MFDRIKKFLFGDNREVKRVVENSVLGQLRFSDDEETWISERGATGESVRFNIAGDWHSELEVIEPSQVLVERAEEIAGNLALLQQKVDGFLRTQIENNPSLAPWRDEVLGLKMSMICLFWPERPLEGEIIFSTSAPAEGRVWACAYINGEPAPTLSFSG